MMICNESWLTINRITNCFYSYAQLAWYNVLNTFSDVGEVKDLKNQTIKGSGSYPRGFVYLPRRAATAARDIFVYISIKKKFPWIINSPLLFLLPLNILFIIVVAFLLWKYQNIMYFTHIIRYLSMLLRRKFEI